METATIGNTACLGNSVNRTASPESDPSSLEAARFHELQLGFSGEYSTPGGELNSSIKCSVSPDTSQGCYRLLSSVQDFCDFSGFSLIFFPNVSQKGGKTGCI